MIHVHHQHPKCEIADDQNELIINVDEHVANIYIHKYSLTSITAPLTKSVRFSIFRDHIIVDIPKRWLEVLSEELLSKNIF